MGWIVLISLTGVPFLAGYFLGFAKGYNQMVREIEDMEELNDSYTKHR
jgi:hypothetical protein